jgi:D-erythrulose 1-phosphate 3-epimerase
MTMRLELGINTCFAVKRWPRPVDWAPIVADRLKLTLVEHSFDLVGLGGGASAAAQDLIGATSAAGLRVKSTFTGLAAYSSNMLLSPDSAERRSAKAWFLEAIEFTDRIGGTAMGGHVGAFSVADWRDPDRRRERWGGLQGELHELAREARSRGLEALLVENLAAAREPSTMAMVRDLLTEGDSAHVPIRLALDVGHMCVVGTSGDDRDPYAWLRGLGRAAFEVQLQQSDAAGDHHWPFTAEANRAGRIDADRVIDALGEGGVENLALILEVIPAAEQDDDAVLDGLAASVDYWSEALARRGVSAS